MLKTAPPWISVQMRASASFSGMDRNTVVVLWLLWEKAYEKKIKENLNLPNFLNLKNLNLKNSKPKSKSNLNF